MRGSAVIVTEDMVIIDGYLQKLSSGPMQRYQSRYFQVSTHYLRYFAVSEATRRCAARRTNSIRVYLAETGRDRARRTQRGRRSEACQGTDGRGCGDQDPDA